MVYGIFDEVFVKVGIDEGFENPECSWGKGAVECGEGEAESESVCKGDFPALFNTINLCGFRCD